MPELPDADLLRIRSVLKLADRMKNHEDRVRENAKGITNFFLERLRGRVDLFETSLREIEEKIQ